MAEGQQPSVAVIEDCDFPNCVGAFWGEINTTIHKGFGVSGVVTNGVVRDLGDLPSGFPVIAGSVGPSHAFVHVKTFGTPVSIFGLAVEQGDLILLKTRLLTAMVLLVIPAEITSSLKNAIETLIATERLIYRWILLTSLVLILKPLQRLGRSLRRLALRYKLSKSARPPEISKAIRPLL